MSLFSRLVLAFSLVLSVSATSAEVAQPSPYAVLENVGNQLFTRIAANQQEIKKFPKIMNDIVEEELMPAIDYKYAAYRILG